jgi:hypothetical protein
VPVSKDDYLVHFSLNLLAVTCMDLNVKNIIPRVILNNMTMMLNSKEVSLHTPRHQNWAIATFSSIRSDMIPDFIKTFQLGDLITNDLLLETSKSQVAKHKYKEAANMIIRYKFHQHFDLRDIMLKLIDLKQTETATLLIADSPDLKVELIKSLATNDNCKKAAKLIKDFKLDPADFPEVKERLMKTSTRYFLSRNMYKKSDSNDYISLHKIEDLFSGYSQMLSYIVEDLVHKEKFNEAKGIFTRNNLKNFVREEVAQRLA